MMTVLVTGFRGKTGRQVAAALLRRGAAVRGCVRGAEGPDVAGVTLTPFDWREPATWCSGMDTPQRSQKTISMVRPPVGRSYPNAAARERASAMPPPGGPNHAVRGPTCNGELSGPAPA